MRSLLEPVLGAQLRFPCALLRDWPACWDRWADFSAPSRFEKQIPGMFPLLSSNDEINIRCGGRRNGGRSRKKFVVLLFFQRRSFTVGVLLIILIKFMKGISRPLLWWCLILLGTPSGIDNSVSTYGGLCQFACGHLDVLPSPKVL